MDQAGRGVIGVLGGMGPWATLELFRRILEATPAERDQDHLHVLIDNNPAVPDRTAAIQGRGESPLPALLGGCRRLAEAGADFIVIPCNTAHFWIEELQQGSPAPVVDMVEEAVAAAIAARADLHRVGLLATTGTVEGGVYRRRFVARGIEVLSPAAEVQRDLVMRALYGPGGIKAGGSAAANRRRLVRAAQALVAAGAEVLLAACTEIPLVLRPEDVQAPLVDTLDCLARAAVERALAGKKE